MINELEFFNASGFDSDRELGKPLIETLCQHMLEKRNVRRMCFETNVINNHKLYHKIR